jgi:hypothetical protein
VVPEETEIVVEGRRIGLARAFRGPAVVPVVAGPHIVELRWRGFSITDHIMVSAQTTVLLKTGPGAFGLGVASAVVIGNATLAILPTNFLPDIRPASSLKEAITQPPLLLSCLSCPRLGERMATRGSGMLVQMRA